MNSSKIPGGYILTSRKMLESEIWSKPPLYFKVWMYLLMRAQFKDYKHIKRGQLIVTIPEIIEACSYKVGYRTEKPTKSQIFNILEWLRNSDEAPDEGYTNETMIDTTKTTRGMLINISNYEVYQDPKSYEQNDEGNDEKPTKTTMLKRQANTINKNVEEGIKNEKNDEELKDTVTNVPDVFEEWWTLYGNKKGRAKCEPKYKSLLKKYTHEQMMAGTEMYIQYRMELVRTNQFCPEQKNPLTFLNGEHFNDEYSNPNGVGHNGVNRSDNAKDIERQARIDETNARRARLAGIEPD